MMQWIVLYKKELVEMWRNYKFIWVPLVFILLGVMQPVTSYFMPQILDSVGGLPEGAIIEIPPPTGPQVLTEVLSNYSMIGVLVLVLSAMGVVAAERQSGVAGMVMIKPVSYFSFISAKWAGLMTISLLSLFLGYTGAWYYTNILIEKVEFVYVWQSLALYSLWIMFVMTVVLLVSSAMKGNGAIAFLSFLSVFGLSAISNIAKKYMIWSPSNMLGHAGSLLNTGEVGDKFILSLVTTIIIVIAMIVLSTATFKQKELLE